MNQRAQELHLEGEALPRSAARPGVPSGGLLLIATIDSHVYAVIALALLAAFTAMSMTLLTTGFGSALARAPLARIAPALGFAGIAFGVWYALGALDLAPYVF